MRDNDNLQCKNTEDNWEIFQEVFSYDFLGHTNIKSMSKSFFHMHQS